MSAFQIALAEFLRLQKAEEVIAAASPKDVELGDNPAWNAATSATQAAFDRMFVISAENGSQAAAKLAALASFYTVPSCGCDPQGWGMLVAEVARFSAAAALGGAA